MHISQALHRQAADLQLARYRSRSAIFEPDSATCASS